MMYHGAGMSVVWSLLVFAVALPALLIIVGLAVAQLQRKPGSPEAPPSESEAERVLAHRLASGEIESEDYEQRLRTLRATRR